MRSIFASKTLTGSDISERDFSPGRHLRCLRKESMKKMRRYAIFFMRKPTKDVGFHDPIEEITCVISPRGGTFGASERKGMDYG